MALAYYQMLAYKPPRYIAGVVNVRYIHLEEADEMDPVTTEPESYVATSAPKDATRQELVELLRAKAMELSRNWLLPILEANGAVKLSDLSDDALRAALADN